MRIHSLLSSAFAFVFALGLLATQARAEDLVVTMQPIRSDSGNLVYAIYDNEAAWDAQKSERLSGTAPAVKGAVNVTVTGLPPGFYAFTVFHDENENGELDTNFLGMPKEMFGISNITRPLWSQPKWDEVKFEIKTNETLQLPLLMKMQ